MSNLLDHTLRELKDIGYTPDSDDPMSRSIFHNTIAIIEAFSRCGHSGSSAEFHTQMIEKLLRFESLTQLTDNPEDWVCHQQPKIGVKGVWQNCRDSRMFSDDGGKTYWNVDEMRHGWRARLFGPRGTRYRSVLQGIRANPNDGPSGARRYT